MTDSNNEQIDAMAAHLEKLTDQDKMQWRKGKSDEVKFEFVDSRGRLEITDVSGLTIVGPDLQSIVVYDYPSNAIYSLITAVRDNVDRQTHRIVDLWLKDLDSLTAPKDLGPAKYVAQFSGHKWLDGWRALNDNNDARTYSECVKDVERFIRYDTEDFRVKWAYRIIEVKK